MNIVLACAHDVDSDRWMTLFQDAVPGAIFHRCSDGTSPVGAEIAVAWNPPQDLLTREPGIRAIFNLGAGVDGLLRLQGLKEDIALFRLEDAGMALQMAEYASFALLRASRRFDEYERLQHQQLWQPLPHIDRSLWPVGVMGMGVMGARVAQTISALGYPVAGWSRSGKALPGIESFAGHDELGRFLARSRVLINTLPLTVDTRDILCAETLSQLKSNAYLINVGRGEHLVEDDLLELLDSGHIGGATLDVFRQEPLPDNHPFWFHPCITVTPHVAAGTLQTEAVAQIGKKIGLFMRGEDVTGRVCLHRGY